MANLKKIREGELYNQLWLFIGERINATRNKLVLKYLKLCDDILGHDAKAKCLHIFDTFCIKTDTPLFQSEIAYKLSKCLADRTRQYIHAKFEQTEKYVKRIYAKKKALEHENQLGLF